MMTTRTTGLRRVVAVAAVVLLGGCGSSDPEPVAGPASTTSTTAKSTTTVDPNTVAESFDIGGGRTLFLSCRGNGSPTILLEAGDESDTRQWFSVAQQLEAETRTCAYDRAGNGRSSEATGCRGVDDLLGDLEALLEVADVGGPYVLVGTSGGGYLMAGFAARHPEDVAGLVLVETPKAITILPPELEAQLKCDAPTNIERRDYVTVEHAVWDVRKQIGEFPMTIFSNEYAPGEGVGDEVTNVEDQRGWLVLSPNSKQVVVTSGHDVAENEPDLVAREILAVLEAAREG